MNLWLDTLIGLLEEDQPAVLVTVAASRGSTPREPGALMIVSRHGLFGTIGGGQLEWQATARARDLLATERAQRDLVRYPLGAKLGQCCGGVAQIAFESLDNRALPWLRRARALAVAGLPWGRVVGLAPEFAECRVFGPQPENDLSDESLISLALELLGDNANHATLLHRNGAGDMLVHVSKPPALEVMLFGAGHVGTALAELLHCLPLRLRWIDSREEADMAPYRERRALIESDDPVAEVDTAPPATAFLVMTQSHALDFDLVRAILRRGDFRYCGLIGSASKRAGFIGRLRERGFEDSLLERIRCPIGIEGVFGKEPEVIAVAVAAEILALREPESFKTSSRPIIPTKKPIRA